jgi:single-strand DNA-binding protein
MNVNKVIISGKLTNDPILKKLNSGSNVLTFNLETKQEFKSASGIKSTFNFIDCAVWGNAAENYSKYIIKGLHILVEGSLALDSFTNQNGEKRSKHKINVQSITLLNLKPAIVEELARQ